MPVPFRVLTFNCWLLRLGRVRVAHDLAARAAAIPDALAATGADVVALQEAWVPDLAVAIADRLRRAGYAHLLGGTPRRPGRVLGDGLMIASRHPLSAPRRLTFAQRSVWYEHLIAKGALAADVALPGGHPLRIVTAHLAVVRYDVRQAAFRADDAATNAGQLDELADWLAEARAPGPMVLAGDLNLVDRPLAAGRQGTAERAGYRALLDRLGLRDAWREHHPDEAGATFDPGTNAYAARGRCRHIPAQRIDYVLYRGPGLASEDAALVFRERPLLSDHYGLRADFRLDAKIPASSAGGVTSSWS